MAELMEPEVKETKAKKPELKKYKVIIHSGEDKGDKGDVVLAHNFRQVLIQRDKEVVIDENLINCLKHSTIDTFTIGENKEIIPVKIPRFSYSVEPV